MLEMLQRVLRQSYLSLGKHVFKMGPLNNSNNLENIRKVSTSKLINFDTDLLVWIDLEMTGLNVDKDRIMEIACLITDSDLNIVAESPDIVIRQPKDLLDSMDEWCIKQHGKTGLTEACLNSQTSLEEAETTIIEFMKQHVEPKSSPLAGNSVYMDRYFLMKQMPKIHDYLHYRIVDVSTVKELCRRWNIAVFKGSPKKEFGHRALNDIRESVIELKYYQRQFFRMNEMNQ